jgi:hypothetical protein
MHFVCRLFLNLTAVFAAFFWLLAKKFGLYIIVFLVFAFISAYRTYSELEFFERLYLFFNAMLILSPLSVIFCIIYFYTYRKIYMELNWKEAFIKTIGSI